MHPRRNFVIVEKQKMNKKTLRKFLIDSNKAGFSTGDSKKWIKEKDGSTTIAFESGDFRMHDNFFGGEPWGGREVIFFREEPVWIMVMYGAVNSSFKDFKKVYKFLQKALLNQPETFPVRGPEIFQEGDFVYTNKIEGNLDNFLGKEAIFKGNNQIYKTNYAGGLVDVQKEE